MQFLFNLFSIYFELMDNTNQLLPFEERRIRKEWHDGQWYFSVVDVIEVLTDSPNPRNYWSMLKRKDNELYTIPVQLKMLSADGKKYKTDAAHTEGVLRIIMSVPSPKAEPLKKWMAQVTKAHIDETENPELGFERLKELYKAKGYSDEWINTRLKSIDIRKQLTDEWKNRGVQEGQEYSILTAEIAKATFGITPAEHKNLKGLEHQNLRDHMTNLELIFTMLGEELTRSEAVRNDAIGFNENHEAAQIGGKRAGDARRAVEKTGEKVVSEKNFLNLNKGESLPELPESKD